MTRCKSTFDCDDLSLTTWTRLYTFVQDAKKNGQTLDQAAIWTFLGVAFVSLFMPHFLTERRMKKHPKTGKSLSVFRIKNGWLYTPRRGKTKLEQFHSATAAQHHKAADEITHEHRHGYQKQGPQKTSEVFRKSSQMQ